MKNKHQSFGLVIILFFFFSSVAQKNEQPVAKEVWEPVPLLVYPYSQNGVPSDALILLGENLDEWQNYNGKEVEWSYQQGVMTVKPGTGGVRTRKAFGSVQLHIEWQIPDSDSLKSGQNKGNSGVFLMGQYEVQILDSYQNKTYSNGQAGSIYKQHIPRVNTSLPPMEWQSFDIIFEAPEFDEEGALLKPAFFTVFQNGILIHHKVEVIGETVNVGRQKYKAHPSKLPLSLQDHSSEISFRNIWIREL